MPKNLAPKNVMLKNLILMNLWQSGILLLSLQTKAEQFYKSFRQLQGHSL